MSGDEYRDDPTVLEQPQRQIAPGTILAGRYVLEEPLGHGGMGTVYAALDTTLEVRVALKLMHPSLAQEPEAIDRFHGEVKLARQVTHRNVARTFDIGNAGGQQFLTMELVEGESLARRVHREGALPLDAVLDVGRQVCEALSAAHESGVIHRDLKPANILIEPGGRVVVTDFGIAFRTRNHPNAPTGSNADVIGTPAYMAPELRRGSPPTPGSDLYALGVTLYELATGQRPVEGSAATLSDTEPRPEPPAALASLIQRCLHRDPAQRITSAQEVAAELQTLGGPTIADVPGPTTPGFASTEPGEHRLAVLPLQYRGPPDDAYLGEAMTEQLVDLLSMTRGLSVCGMGATARFAADRDPQQIQRALEVDSVIDGTLQRAGSRLRVIIRLIDAHSARQTWCETFDGELTDVFEVQDRIATRVAETLRVTLLRRDYEYSAPPEVIEMFLRARLHMQTLEAGNTSQAQAAALLDRCRTLAPGFPPAIAFRAVSYASLLFHHRGDEDERDMPSLCREAVDQAQQLAADFPETHLAAGRMHAQFGDFVSSARALQRALELAPTHAATHGFLGTLQCEAGRAAEGRRHVALATQLDPSDLTPLFAVARDHALDGDFERFESLIETMWAHSPGMHALLLAMRLRIAMWRRDDDAIRHWHARLAPTRLPFVDFLTTMTHYVLDDLPLVQFEAVVHAASPATAIPRQRAIYGQLFIEGLLLRDEHALALTHLESLAQTLLVDIDWLQRCPLLVPLQGSPSFETIEHQVKIRAQAIWSVG